MGISSASRKSRHVAEHHTLGWKITKTGDAMEADKASVVISYPRYGVIVGQILMSLFASVSGTAILVGFLLAISGQLFALMVSVFGIFFILLTNRWYYIPVEFNQTHIVCKHLLWTRKLPIKNITWININTYDMLTWNFKTVEHESILMKVNGVFLKYVSFLHLPKSDGAGEYLTSRIGESKSVC
jgi:hypothetical protein